MDRQVRQAAPIGLQNIRRDKWLAAQAQYDKTIGHYFTTYTSMGGGYIDKSMTYFCLFMSVFHSQIYLVQADSA